jgi:ubiquinone/menaquinone biosynthesis C-methylase UbiE
MAVHTVEVPRARVAWPSAPRRGLLPAPTVPVPRVLAPRVPAPRVPAPRVPASTVAAPTRPARTGSEATDSEALLAALAEAPDERLSDEKYDELAESYDAASLAAVPLRVLAVSALSLRAGETVVDIGCGTGLNFGAIRARVGSSGVIIGVDACARMLASARRRVEEHGWRNVTLVHAPAGAAALPAAVDAVLLSLVHDVMRSPDALRHVLGALRPGGRVCAAGAKLASPWSWWAPLLNPLVVQVNRPYVTSTEGLGRPWDHLASLVPGLSVTVDPWDVTYVASGTLPPPATPR